MRIYNIYLNIVCINHKVVRDMKTPEEIFDEHELADQKREAKIKEQFEDQTGLEAEEILQCFPFDRSVTIHTMTRTFQAKLTEGGKQLIKGFLMEDTIDGLIPAI